ncbi:MAG: hypothetical protein K2X86_18535 [Cytophagaceae bacterium]|nr:hypothetical protein [Cytophagaceae bacterium]
MKECIYYQETEFDFGQFKDKALEEIFYTNFSYVKWCMETINGFCIPPVVFDNLIKEGQKKGVMWTLFYKIFFSKELLENNKQRWDRYCEWEEIKDRRDSERENSDSYNKYGGPSDGYGGYLDDKFINDAGRKS